MGDNAQSVVTATDRAEALRVLREVIGIDTEAAPDPLIDLAQIAELAGLPKNTIEVWRQRSRPNYTGKGKLRVPFPQPSRTASKEETGFLPKPRWRAISVVLPWLIDTRRWPRGVARRPRTAA